MKLVSLRDEIETFKNYRAWAITNSYGPVYDETWDQIEDVVWYEVFWTVKEVLGSGSSHEISIL